MIFLDKVQRKSKAGVAAGLMFLLGSIVFNVSCTEKPKAGYDSPKGYNLLKPDKYNMPESLTEISGIAFYHGKPDTIYAEQDEEGKVFYMHLGDKKAEYTKFGKDGDYEDMTILNEQVVLLRSNGALFTFPFNQLTKPDVANVQKWKDILPPGEYEGMYGDEKTGLLYVLCKHCNDDNTSKTTSGYIFKLADDGSVKQAGQFNISVKQIEALAGKNKITFHPSALAKNPVTKEWYILSSVNKLLVIADADFNVKALYALDPSTFRQPEGMAFDNQNNLYISNEGDTLSPGNILKFAYTK